MVSPIILGAGAALAGLGVSFLGKKGPRLYVAWVSKGNLLTKRFPSEEEAKEFQKRLAEKGYASVIIVKESGDPQFKCMNPVPGRPLSKEERQAMKTMWERRRAYRPASLPSDGEGVVVMWMVPDGEHMVPRRKVFKGPDADRAAGEFRQDLEAQQIPSKVMRIRGIEGRHDDFDTLEEQFRTRYASARGDELPTESEESYRARMGPYPEIPDFRETPSSHEYKTEVRTRTIPGYKGYFKKDLVNLNPLSMHANVG
jgi:hypothetical protein